MIALKQPLRRGTREKKITDFYMYVVQLSRYATNRARWSALATLRYSFWAWGAHSGLKPNGPLLQCGQIGRALHLLCTLYCREAPLLIFFSGRDVPTTVEGGENVAPQAPVTQVDTKATVNHHNHQSSPLYMVKNKVHTSWYRNGATFGFYTIIATRTVLNLVHDTIFIVQFSAQFHQVRVSAHMIEISPAFFVWE